MSSLNGDRRGGFGNTLLYSAKLIIIEQMVEIISAVKITNRFWMAKNNEWLKQTNQIKPFKSCFCLRNFENDSVTESCTHNWKNCQLGHHFEDFYFRWRWMIVDGDLLHCHPTGLPQQNDQHCLNPTEQMLKVMPMMALEVYS